MARLAIRGHESRDKEVIEILEMLGGKNNDHLCCETEAFVYSVNSDDCIDYYLSETWVGIQYTLEEFLEKFPYKVGDEVIINDCKDDVYTISEMNWDGERIVYKIRDRDGNIDNSVWRESELLPYKEQETMEEKPLLARPTEKEGYYCITKEQYDSVNIAITEKESKIMFDKHITAEKIELIMGDDFEVKQEDGKWFVVKKQPQYPKTYEECCKIVNASPYVKLVYNISDGHKYSYDEDNLQLYENIRRLKICRDAYWKIAGEQMGLSKPWEPDFLNDEQIKFCLYNSLNYVLPGVVCETNEFLVFPTAEMRDAFYVHFESLIRQCKELL